MARAIGPESLPDTMHSLSNPTVIRSEDSNAVEQIQAKIAAAEKLQATMKAANQIVRQLLDLDPSDPLKLRDLMEGSP